MTDGVIRFTDASRLLSSHACRVTAADGLTRLNYATAGFRLNNPNVRLFHQHMRDRNPSEGNEEVFKACPEIRREKARPNLSFSKLSSSHLDKRSAWRGREHSSQGSTCLRVEALQRVNVKPLRLKQGTPLMAFPHS